MRKRIQNIVLSILSVSLAVTLFFVGVLAATSADAVITNTFFFDVDENDFFVNIVGEVSGYAGDEVIPNYVHNYQNAAPENFVRWEVPNLVFAEENGIIQDLVFTFTVENHHQDRTISVEVVDYQSDPPSTKIVNIPSPRIVLEPIRFEGGNQIYDYDIITVRVSVLDQSIDFTEYNTFRLLFSVVE